MIKDRIRYERLTAELTTEALAALSGIKAPTIRRMETTNGYPNSLLLYKMAVALSIPMDRFFKPMNNHELSYIKSHSWSKYNMKKVKSELI